MNYYQNFQKHFSIHWHDKKNYFISHKLSLEKNVFDLSFYFFVWPMSCLIPLRGSIYDLLYTSGHRCFGLTFGCSNVINLYTVADTHTHLQATISCTGQVCAHIQGVWLRFLLCSQSTNPEIDLHAEEYKDNKLNKVNINYKVDIYLSPNIWVSC